MTNLRRPGAMSSQPFRQVCQFLRPATGANGRQRGRARADTAGDRNTLFCRVRPRVRLLLPRPRRPAERHDRIQSRRHSEALPSTSDGSPKFAPAPSPRPVSDISRRKPSHVRLDNTRVPRHFDHRLVRCGRTSTTPASTPCSSRCRPHGEERPRSMWGACTGCIRPSARCWSTATPTRPYPRRRSVSGAIATSAIRWDSPVPTTPSEDRGDSRRASDMATVRCQYT